MSRARNTLLPAGILVARLLMGQEKEPELPPEEDAALNAPKQYGFNPVQSKKEVVVGDYHMKKGNYLAAASRYIEATKWNDNNADAWLKLGEAQDKHGDSAAAKAAWQHYLELAPDGKTAVEVKKKLSKLKTS